MGGPAPRVLVADPDRALIALIEEWLGDAGCTVVRDFPECEGARSRCDLAIVDVPHARLGGSELVRRIRDEHPGMPILALSTTFFPGIEACGPVARSLGVDCVLAKPVSREALTAAVRHLLAR